MKRIKKLVVLLMICLLTMAIPVSASAAEKISKKSVTLIKGQSTTLKVTGTKDKITWSSSKKSVATVSSKGKVVAKKTGTATITAKYGKKKLTCKVTVETPKISKTAVTINAKKSYQLKVTGTKQKIKWSSSKTSVATVSNGKVVGKKAGTATITATVGGKKYSCKVTVKNNMKPVTKVVLDKTALLMDVGSQEVLQVSYLPLDTTDSTNVKWTSSNNKVATVESGIITAVKAGKTTISATIGRKKASCVVQVNESYGTVSGSVTWHYNEYRGYVADTDAKVFLIPTDGSASKYKEKSESVFLYPSSYIQKLRDNSIYCAEVDGNGNYTISNIPTGEYIAFIISNNSKGSDWFDAFDDSLSDAPDSYYKDIADFFETYLNSSTALALAKSTIMYRYTFDSIVVQRNQNVTLSHAFPYTYI